LRARRIVLLLSVLAAGCGSLNLAIPPAPRQPAASAQAIVENGLKDWRPGFGGSVCLNCEIESARVSSAGATFQIRRTRGDGEGTGATVRVPFDGPILEAKSDMGVDWVIWLRAAPSGGWLVKINEDADAQRFVDAYNDLVALNRGADGAEIAFGSQAAAWRATNPKPPLSEAGARNKVLAENAFREKNVDGAIRYYTAALDTDPTWPNGNFNLALLLAEAGDYALAARHMKRYLLLEPNAKDAKAANDKAIVWEEKARNGS
jgi:tetratricopeptide (TPR) repeat protein